VFADEVIEPFLLSGRQWTPCLLRGDNYISPLEFETANNILWQRVGKPESDKVNRVLCFPVRQSPSRADIWHGEILSQVLYRCLVLTTKTRLKYEGAGVFALSRPLYRWSPAGVFEFS
jgi:hypothetical protein